MVENPWDLRSPAPSSNPPAARRRAVRHGSKRFSCSMHS
ncbi:Hypothetical protein A7982_09737 [Minicystis rosea]|nr:Hypothetical protein A7982_09737 [Minicystis rosea]